MRLLHYSGGTSYALFLVHFPVLMLVSAVFEHYRPGDPLLSTLGLFVAWLASMLVADLFHRYVELPLLHWQRRHFRSQAPVSAMRPPTVVCSACRCITSVSRRR